jgi:nucleoside-diphosphate kinase
MNFGGMSLQRTFAMLKPGSIQRGLIGRIISRFEDRGLKIVALKMMMVSRELAEKHYGEHKQKPFFNDLVNYITSGPVVAMVLEGPHAVSVVRKMMGKTDPLESDAGTVRGDFGLFTGKNIVHPILYISSPSLNARMVPVEDTTILMALVVFVIEAPAKCLPPSPP